MFAKLLKMEWRATKGLIGVLCLAIAVSSILAGGIVRYMIWSAAMGNGFMVVVYTVVLTVAVLVMIGSCFATLYLMAYRFYKRCFSEEGYLIFSLPVSTHQLLLSGIVSSLRGVVIVGTVACVSVLAAGAISLSIFRDHAVAEILQAGEAFRISAVEGIGPMVLVVLESILSLLMELILLMLAITVASLAARNGTAKGLGVYFGVSIVLSVLTELVRETTVPLTAGLLLNIGCSLVVILGGYFWMHHLMAHKLNLN